MVEFFQSNKGLDLEQITSATLMKLEEIKERTAAGKECACLHKHQLNTQNFVYSNANIMLKIV